MAPVFTDMDDFFEGMKNSFFHNRDKNFNDLFSGIKKIVTFYVIIIGHLWYNQFLKSKPETNHDQQNVRSGKFLRLIADNTSTFSITAHILLFYLGSLQLLVTKRIHSI
jgi:hypothetical protein